MSTCQIPGLMTPAAFHGPKRFSLAEANDSLVYVSRITRDLVFGYRRLVETRRRIERPGANDNIEQLEAGYEKAMDCLSRLVDELHAVGVELVDPEVGLVDFPTEHQGRAVYFCWRHGDTEITWWRDSQSSFADLRDISDLMPSRAA